ncbi:MAG: alpha-glucosidase/alpha-galactosidase, partial [Pseudomonadota bacterium]
MVKLAFIGAGSTIFMKNIVGDMLHFPALADAEIALMDIDAARLEESAMLVRKMIAAMGTGATVSMTTERARALE